MGDEDSVNRNLSESNIKNASDEIGKHLVRESVVKPNHGNSSKSEDETTRHESSETLEGCIPHGKSTAAVGYTADMQRLSVSGSLKIWV